MPESYNLSLLLGDVAEQDVKASRDLMVLDRVATRKKREAAYQSTPSVFDLDDRVAPAIKDQVHRLFARGRTIFQAPPIISPIFQTLDSVNKPAESELLWFKNRFLSAFNLEDDDGTFEALAETEFSPKAEKAVLDLVMDILNQGVLAEKSSLLDLPPAGVVVRRVYSKHEDLVPYAAVFPGSDEAKRLVAERSRLLSDDFQEHQVEAIVKVAQSLLRPNLLFNGQETEKRREEAAKTVSPVFFQVKQGEMIVREGERVEEPDRLKLEAMAREVDQDWLPTASGYLLMAAIFLVVTVMVGFSLGRNIHLKDRDLVFLSTLILINLFLSFTAAQVGDAMGHGWPGVSRTTITYLAPLAGGAMLATIFLGPLIGVFYAVVGSGLSALVLGDSLNIFLYCFLGAVVGLAGVRRVRERSAVIRAGLMVGLVNMGAIVALGLIDPSTWSKGIVFSLIMGLLSGTLAGVMVTGLVPLFEMVFKYTTNIKLLELTNLDRPILRELMVQAPGTYHHSVIVGAMVEAAAEAIGANPLMAKVSAYYHDLGKMKKPLYFVENQGLGDNKHEKLAPSMSSLILISHVKDGVELARRHKLSQEIVDIIQQHHGTSLIAYFYHKAQNGRSEDQPDINIEDYRYPGPKPQTREAGLVMLADAVEAASRSIKEPTPSRVQGMVQKLINNIFSDGQLDECELTLKDLHLIARSFNTILTGIFHRRIAYPEPASKEAAARQKAAHAPGTKQPPKDTSDPDRPDKGKRKDDLKRLGMS